MVGSWRTFIHLKGIGRLGSNTSKVAKSGDWVLPQG
jgi:hypothetical protein